MFVDASYSPKTHRGGFAAMTVSTPDPAIHLGVNFSAPDNTMCETVGLCSTITRFISTTRLLVVYCDCMSAITAVGKYWCGGRIDHRYETMIHQLKPSLTKPHGGVLLCHIPGHRKEKQVVLREGNVVVDKLARRARDVVFTTPQVQEDFDTENKRIVHQYQHNHGGEYPTLVKRNSKLVFFSPDKMVYCQNLPGLPPRSPLRLRGGTLR